MNKKKIINRIIENKNPISMDEYINLCLYDVKGYYQKKNIIGSSGDFITAPEISQLFGEIIGLYIYLFWKNNIDSFTNLIEIGPGNGTLLKDILNITKTFLKFNNNIEICLIEKNLNLIKLQREKLNYYLNSKYKISWNNDFEDIPKKPCIIYANEFLDCLPVKQFYFKNKVWLEKMVNYNSKEKQLFLEDKEVVNKKILLSLKNENENGVVEYSKERDDYFVKICKFLSNFGGICIIIDYGYDSILKNFTLQAINNNKQANILDNPGDQDITSLVDFNKLIKIAKLNNLKIRNYTSQREFLLSNGLLERKNILLKENHFHKNIIQKGYERLIDKNSMGSLFKILIVSK